MIYKDECTRCFITPKHEKGLNVCLKDYQGCCDAPGEAHDHTTVHHQLTGNCIYLNITMVPKKEEG